MTPEEALKVLTKMRAWRRWGKGEQDEKDRPEMPEQKEVDEAFDVCIEMLSGFSRTCNFEEAAKEFANQDCVTFISRKKGFIAGAKWQENKDQETIKLAEDHAFLAGADWQKEQMLKEAIEATLDNTAYPTRLWFNTYLSEYSNGDKVRVIVLPQGKLIWRAQNK